MGLVDKVEELQEITENFCGAGTIFLHAFSDLSHVSPVVFLYLLKEYYFAGTLKATVKFRALQQQVHFVLHNSPQPGPASFIIHCLYALPLLEAFSEGFSHLIISSLRRYLKCKEPTSEALEARNLAAKLFLDILGGFVVHDEKVVAKILETFDVKLINIENAVQKSDPGNSNSLDTAKTIVEQYIFEMIESDSYMTAVTLLEQFSIRQSGQSFLLKMMQNKQFKAAEKWATFMGKPMLCVLVQQYLDRKLVKTAYEIIKKNNLRQDFPDVYQKCKESSLKKLAEKGCWDIAEARTNSDRQLVEYLVYLAMEAGYSEKVDELCNRHSLKGFVKANETEGNLLHNRYLQIDKLLLEDVVWVDEGNSLLDATCHIEGCKVAGLDCEWKPNYEKGSRPNRVSIMQIASEKKVFILDLIKLFEDVPDVLDDCLTRILHSPRVLKLGYNFQCDIKQLSHSYETLQCFKHFEMLLDIQNVFKEPRGGLSGLAKKILGAGLNKTRRNSNWEQRPLTQNQLEYAALDAVVLVHIFHHVHRQSQPGASSEGRTKIEWKSYIIPRMDYSKSKKENKSKKTIPRTVRDEHSEVNKSKKAIPRTERDEHSEIG